MAGIRTRSRPNLGDESEFGKTGCAARRHPPANHGNSLAQRTISGTSGADSIARKKGERLFRSAGVFYRVFSASV